MSPNIILKSPMAYITDFFLFKSIHVFFISFEFPESPSFPCNLPKSEGPCTHSLHRFYFDGANCKHFLYGGCQGNANNFLTLQDCQDKCNHKNKSQERCEMPRKEVGFESYESIKNGPKSHGKYFY